jgi:polyribonucleotide nucleotidyltransferase
MSEVLAAPRQSISSFAPRIVTIRIPVDKIRDVIGPGGKMIRSIIERTGVKIDVEDDGRVNVASADEAAAAKAIGIIQELTATPELNKTYMGKVQRITDFGAFVEIMPGTEGLLHISEMRHTRVDKTEDVTKKGDRVTVKLIERDERGRLRLSMKALMPKPEGEALVAAGEGGAAAESQADGNGEGEGRERRGSREGRGGGRGARGGRGGGRRGGGDR